MNRKAFSTTLALFRDIILDQMYFLQTWHFCSPNSHDKTVLSNSDLRWQDNALWHYDSDTEPFVNQLAFHTVFAWQTVHMPLNTFNTCAFQTWFDAIHMLLPVACLFQGLYQTIKQWMHGNKGANRNLLKQSYKLTALWTYNEQY